MVAYNKHNAFVEYLTDMKMDLFGSPIGDTLKVMLTNVAPIATNSVKADLTEISAGNGYTAGGTAVSANGTRSSGVMTLDGDQVVFTASGGTMATFQYVDLYDDTPTSPADPLIAWWDNGATVSLANGETFTVKFNNATTDGTIFTLS